MTTTSSCDNVVAKRWRSLNATIWTFFRDVDEEVSDTELEEEQRKYMGGIENEEDDMEEQDVVDEKEVDVKREDNESETDEAIRAEYGLDNYDEEGKCC